MRRLIWILLALLPCLALAGALDRVEASLVVTGWVEVAPDGSVHAYTLDQAEKLDPGVGTLIGKTIAGWKFKPILVAGKPVLAKAKMNLRIVASPHGKDEYEIRLRGASFGDGEPGDWPSYKDRTPPKYPFIAVQARTEGTVYLVLEVDHTGRVEQAVAQQVNLRAIGTEHEMKTLREAFAKSSIAAAKDWTFNIPVSGAHANDDHWTVSVPINFRLTEWGNDPQERKYGEWDSYVPGPVQPIPWEQQQLGDGNADAVPDGPAFLPDKRFVLLTPPSPG